MAGYSREEILARMEGSSITLGWGAVAAFNRARLNNLLEQQYLSRLHEHRYLPDFFGRFDDPQHNAYIQLAGIEFGTPWLSFENASITGSRATLSMNVIGGRVATRRLSDESLLATYDLSEGLGYRLTMAIDLALIEGQVDSRGTVSLDMASGSQLTCDVPVGDWQGELNRALQVWFGQLPAHRTVFSLGVIEFIGEGPLTPKSFIIRTQAAPGATFKRAENFGDGAVLTFIQLQGNATPGLTPDSNFPYLIPDDLQGNDARYSATVVVAEDMLEHVEPGQLQILGSLLFPDSQAFLKVDEATPHDLAVFGNIAPLSSSLRVEPSMIAMRPGAKQPFKLFDAKGNSLVATKWTAISLSSHLPEGNGTIDSSGNYTAALASVMGHETLTVVVTATYRKGNKEYKASARAFVMHEVAQLVPRISTQAWSATPVALLAGHGGGNQVNWSLLGPQFGALETTERGTFFTADNASNRLPIALQRVQAEHGEKTHAGILMLNAWFPVPGRALASNPQRSGDSKRIKPGQQVQFTFPHADFLPNASRNWRTLGAGSVDAKGMYKSAMDEASGADAVVCDLEQDNVTYNGAFQLLQLSALEEEETWTELQTFRVTQPAGQSKMYANGYQQLQIEIEVETADRGGINYPLSPKERDSIVLVNERSSAVVEMLAEAFQGIENPNLVYAARVKRNLFKMPISNSTPPTRKAGKSVYQTLYLHVNDPMAVATKFYAKFTKEGGGEFRSYELDGEKGVVAVSPVASPTFKPGNYTFGVKRVQGDGDPAEKDNWYLNLRTRDYWELNFNEGDFFTHEFVARTADWGVKEDVNKTMLRFENDHPNEIMASYTGFIFEEKYKGTVEGEKEEESKGLQVVFDLKANPTATGEENVTNPWGSTVDYTVFTTGTFVVTNDRLDNATYTKADDRKRLSQPMVVKLIDDVGNPHHIQFTYGPQNDSGDRNTVKFTIVTPKA
jgi:hypothetical protein